jgi:signal transduction histidine kinase
VIPAGITFVLFVAVLFLVVLPFIESSLLDRKRDMIKQLTTTAWSTLAHYERLERDGILSREEAQRAALDQLRDVRYGSYGKDYFWINDWRPSLVMHPYRPDLLGRDMSNFPDVNGKMFFLDFLDTVKAHGEGYVDYMWQWPDDSTRIGPKLSYVKGFAPWGWIVGTGIYLDDVNAEIGLLTRRIVWLALGIILVVSLALYYTVSRGIRAERRRVAA